MHIRIFGHNFVPFKSSERICWTCGYVTPRYNTPEEIKDFILEESGPDHAACGHAWHKQVPITAEMKDAEAAEENT